MALLEKTATQLKAINPGMRVAVLAAAVCEKTFRQFILYLILKFTGLRNQNGNQSKKSELQIRGGRDASTPRALFLHSSDDLFIQLCLG